MAPSKQREAVAATLFLVLVLLLIFHLRWSIPGFRLGLSDQQASARFSYIFYATEDLYACSVLVNVDRIRSVFHSLLPIHVLVTPDVSRHYIEALEARNATISVHDPPPLGGDTADRVPYYRDCLLKLLAFQPNITGTDAERVLALDADQLVLNPIDRVFDELPANTSLAVTPAYWQRPGDLSSVLMLIRPNEDLWRRVEEAIATVGVEKYDMDIVNALGDARPFPTIVDTLNSHWESWDLPPGFCDGPDFCGDIPKQLSANLSTVSDRTGHSGELLFNALNILHRTTGVVHFTAVGKPWSYTIADVKTNKPNAHPGLYQQWKIWRETAGNVCAAGVVGEI